MYKNYIYDSKNRFIAVKNLGKYIINYIFLNIHLIYNLIN